MKLFAVATLCANNKSYQTQLGCSVVCANTEKEAKDIALDEIKNKFPINKGYTNYLATAMEIKKEICIEVL